jgi:hypothetical protein
MELGIWLSFVKTSEFRGGGCWHPTNPFPRYATALARVLPPPDPIPSVLCPQLNLFNPPLRNKIPGYATDSTVFQTRTHHAHVNAHTHVAFK